LRGRRPKQSIAVDAAAGLPRGFAARNDDAGVQRLGMNKGPMGQS